MSSLKILISRPRILLYASLEFKQPATEIYVYLLRVVAMKY